MNTAVAKNPDWIRQAIILGNEFHYKKKNPLLHNAINLFTFTMLLAAIVGTLLLGGLVRPLVYIPIAAMVLGVLFLGIVTLVDHEGGHNMFIVSRNSNTARFWNRFFGWAVALFFAMNFNTSWEKEHLEHHVHPLEDSDDAYYRELPVGWNLVKELVKMILIPAYLLVIEHKVQQKHPSPHPQQKDSPPKIYCFIVTGVLWLIVLSLTGLTISWAVPVAAFLGLQVMSAIELVKLVLEHGGSVKLEDNRFLRARTSLFPLRPILLPINISLHFEHHLNYCVPWYDLPRYHRALLDVVPRHIQPYVFNHDIWSQLSGQKGKVPSTAQSSELLQPKRV
jgi:fatty acid desaturase